MYSLSAPPIWPGSVSALSSESFLVSKQCSTSPQTLLTICPGAFFGWFRLPSWAAAGLRYSSDCRDVFLVFSGNLDDIKRYQMIWLSNDLQRSHYPLSNTFPAPKGVYPTPRIPLVVRCIRDVRCIRKTKTHYPIIALLRGSQGLSAQGAWRTLSSRPEGPQP